MREDIKNLFVIGAGFSAGLGYPLTTHLLPLIYSRMDSSFKARFNKVVRFHHPGWNKRPSTLPNIEELLTEWTANEELLDAIRPNGPFQPEDINNLREKLLWSIAAWFHEIHETQTHERKQIIGRFLNRLDKLDRVAIISFNWDYELDRALFGTKKESVKLHQYHYGVNHGTLNDLALLKPHGSLNWFSGQTGKHIKEKKRLLLWDENSASQTMYCFLRWRGPVSSHGRAYVPYIIPPTHWKSFTHPMMQFVWKRCVDAISTAETIHFLGYSLPLADWHARYIFRCGFHNQIEGVPLSGGTRRHPRRRHPRVVIVNPDNEAFRRIESVVGSECEWVPNTINEWLK